MSRDIGRTLHDAHHLRCGRVLLCATVVAFLTLWLFATSATAGRLIETGEVADVSCVTNPALGACHFLRVALDYVRMGAPDPSRPVLVFDEGPDTMVKAILAAYGGSPPFPVESVAPSGIPNFNTFGLTPANFSAIVVASDYSCGAFVSGGPIPCGDLNSPPFFGCTLPSQPPDLSCATVDSNALIAQPGHTVINNFYDDGGGILVGSGGDNGDGHGGDLYYDFVNTPRGLPFQGDPSTIMPPGHVLGFTDSDIAHSGCPEEAVSPPSVLPSQALTCPFDAFFPLPAASSLKVAETDNFGNPVTLFQDTNPPSTTITSAPPPVVVSPGPTSAAFTFAPSENLVTFECRLDSGAFTPCSSPATYGNLGEGDHVFSVRATDAAGNREAAPPAASWLIAFDQDGDGFTRFSNPPDCNDSNAGIHPGAPEARGGHVDTDCDGVVDPFLRIHAAPRFQVEFAGGSTLVTQFGLSSVPVGSTAHVSCARRRRCPFKAVSVTVKRGHTKVNLLRVVRGRKLRAGVVLVVRITGPQSIGFYWSEAIRKPPKLPSQDIQCMNPGSVRPQSVCPSYGP